ncbi:class I SAM-dependent methyltransferase [Microbispora sp. NPDC049125]|uniref:class I SAM-dependent methyltransferase n=1 Tax=Microbispora sp. NPDC049125 TaxID=3154929 RepID=UPI003467B765
MTEPSFIHATRESYDAIAVHHPGGIGPDLEGKPLDRALLAVFAEWVRAAGNGPVADVGCGEGGITRALHDLRVDAFGVDLSPEMVALARRRHPDLRFEVGSMLALDIPDGSLSGVLACYSIIHVPWERRPEVFAEFHRVLAPGGHLMLIFQVGDDRGHRDELDGLEISLDWYRQRPDEVADLLDEAGFEARVSMVRAPEPGVEKVPQGYLLVRKPPGSPRHSR